jgi:predicted RecB family nuclease
MQKIGHEIVYSASDLVHFMECQHLSILDRLHLEHPMEKAEDSEEAAIIQNRGFAHEAAYLEKAKAAAGTFIDIAQAGRTRDQKVAATIQAMEQGIDLVFQAAFFEAPLVGYADFLVKVDTPSKLGNYSYEIIDTKLAKTTRAKFIIQLAFYADLLARVQGRAPIQVHIVLGNGNKESFHLDDYRYYYQHLKHRFFEFIQQNEQRGIKRAAEESTPFPCDKCSLCHWRERCNAWWDETDHLVRVANIQKTHIHKLNAAGIYTIEALANLPPHQSIRKIPKPVLVRLQHQASLQHRAKVSGKRIVELIPPQTPEDGNGRPKDIDAVTEIGPRGFARMPPPSPHDLFFDMEGFPHVEDGLEYLFGLYYLEEDKPVFKAFWAHSRAEERIAFEQWVDFVIQHLDHYPEAHIYHYAAYEKTAIRKLMRLHGTRENEVDRLLRERKLIDLYQVVREAIRISERSYSIKYVEKFYLDDRSVDVQSAGASIVAYQRYRDSDPPDNAILESIERYNEDDVRSTYMLREWLIKQRPEGTPWLEPKADQEESSKHNDSRQEKARTFEEDLRELHTQISRYAPSDPESVNPTPIQRHATILRDLLDFHRRAAKPQWWALFDRQAKNAEERAEDIECILGATLVDEIAPIPEQRSYRYTYRYPAQEVKLKNGDKPVFIDTVRELNEFTINHEERLLTFKFGKNALPDSPVDIGAGKPVDSSALQGALFRYARSFLAEMQGEPIRYQAIGSLLRRDHPNIKGIKPGQALLPQSAKTDDIVSVVSRLDKSVIFIQGPPGAGKTYTASKVIVSLLQNQKRVGVSSNSHKAIVNLLQAVEKVAKEEGFGFRGVKKSDPIDPGQMVKGEFITDIKEREAVIASDAQLIGGTAWLFADLALDQQLDYLFVDEAGQVALGMLLPMATSAKNIVLLGDQMQLAQPVEGVHPGESGDSVLDYLLQGQATIPQERGIFLENTWRMHPAVCGFISDAIYNGRLKSHPNTETRTLVLKTSADPALKPAGIHFEAITHEGCAQSSDEEADRVEKLYESLLQQHYLDDKGIKRAITPENILIVSPYNMQVNLLKRYIGSDARVGTVDKFQGQEAEVVIISMATSSGDEMPRNIDFLFSKNRLNVAISRAKCLAILIASPELFSVQCRTPEEIALVNTFCWAWAEFA